MQGIFGKGRGYWRLQPTLAEEGTDPTDYSSQTLEKLENAAHSLHSKMVEVARELAENTNIG